MRSYRVLTILLAVACAQCTETGYVSDSKTGLAYRLVYRAQPWEKAVEVCESEGAKLAVPKTQEQFSFIQRLVRAMHYPSITGAEYKLLAWLGVYNLGDYRVWRNVDGENIKDTGYHTWASEVNGVGYSDDPSEPHCAGLDAVNPGLREYWCKEYQPFICQKTVLNTKL